VSASAESHDRYRMWGGRFQDDPDPGVAPLLTSLPVDRHLLRWDLLGSLAHLTGIAEAGVVPPEAARTLGRTLRELLTEESDGRLVAAGDYEDVHSFVESTLSQRLGPVAGWLHTGRSRNDQVVTAFRLDLKARVRTVFEQVTALQAALLEQVGSVEGLIVPGYTHLQRAQPVLLGHVWLAYFWMLHRDATRLQDAYRRLDVLPLGSGAIAGSGFRVDRKRMAALLGFDSISENSIDATADRDFVFETLSGVAGLLLHLSRWAEELILWSTQEFGFLTLPDAIMTGSSLMPQKRNPDLLELVRAQAGVGLGALMSIGAVIKGVPSGYNRDLQEDKTAAASAFGAAAMALPAMLIVARRMAVNRARLQAALRGGFLTATEVADYLVPRGVPFREAHRIAGEAVRAAEAAGCELWELRLDAYRTISPKFDSDIVAAVTPEGSVASKDVPGGTAPARVAEALRAATATLVVQQSWAQQSRVDQAAAEVRLLRSAPA
jgi:argininosuccinate lyase